MPSGIFLCFLYCKLKFLLIKECVAAIWDIFLILGKKERLPARLYVCRRSSAEA
jgi:hypothetical protein